MYTHDRMFASVQELLSHSRFAFFVFPFSSAFTKDGSVVPISFRHTAGCISWSRLPFPMVHARQSHGTGEARRPRFVRPTKRALPSQNAVLKVVLFTQFDLF